jgi:hypothetical protein
MENKMPDGEEIFLKKNATNHVFTCYQLSQEWIFLA